MVNHKQRILVADDIPDNLFVLKATLEQAGYDVITAQSGEEVLSILESAGDSIDLVLSDVMMPGLSGYDLCRHLRIEPRFKDIPIVLITSKRRDEEDMVYGMEAGADDYLNRPIDPRLLIKKIQSLLGRKLAQDYWHEKYQQKTDELTAREWWSRMLVHDMRSPLTGAKGYLSLLANDPNLSFKQREWVVKIQRAVEQQEGMLQDLLTFAAAYDGKLKLKLESFDLCGCVREQISNHWHAAQQRGIVFNFHGANQEHEILADYQLLGRVIANLLTNAIKYSFANTEVQIWVSSLSDAPFEVAIPGSVAFFIANEGLTIPKADQADIFKPFVRSIATSGPLQRPQGVGLGLCFCEQIIRLHRGEIDVISPIPGKEDGALFYFVLP